MPPVPENLWSYWNHAGDNFCPDMLGLISAEDYDGPHSHVKSWSCPNCEDFWRTSIRNMGLRSNPCRHCNPSSQGISSNRRGLPHILGIDSVEAVNPEISGCWGNIFVDESTLLFINEDDPWPDELLPGSHKHIKLVCTRRVDNMGRYDPIGESVCNHTSYPRLGSVTKPISPDRDSAKCPSCSLGGDAINNFDSKNALTTTNPVVASELIYHPDGKTADEIKAGSMKRCGWRCYKCEHEFMAGINGRTKNGIRYGRTECPACENLEVHLDGRNSLESVYPNVAKHWDHEKNGELTPANVTFGSTYDVYWICQHTEFTDKDGECGHSNKQRVYSKTQFIENGSSHVSCEKCCPGGGYKDFLQGYYYVLEWLHPSGRFVYKNGKSNVPIDRIYRLAKSLYETFGVICNLVQIITHVDGAKISELERRNLKSDCLINDVDFLGVDGMREMFSMNMIDYASVNGDLPEGWKDVTDDLRSQIENAIYRATRNEEDADSVT